MKAHAKRWLLILIAVIAVASVIAAVILGAGPALCVAFGGGLFLGGVIGFASSDDPNGTDFFMGCLVPAGVLLWGLPAVVIESIAELGRLKPKSWFVWTVGIIAILAVTVAGFAVGMGLGYALHQLFCWLDGKPMGSSQE